MIQQYTMIEAGDTVCVGVSGGADSICLLRILCAYYGNSPEGTSEKEASGAVPAVRLAAVHVDHRLRGADSDADAAFVRELCRELQVPLRVFSYPVAEIAKERGIGTEEAGRLVRREAYRACMDELGARKIALAHQANDRAETFLFHAARGTSVAGLAGIRPVQPFSPERPDCLILRPLLGVTRDEIEDWLRAHGYPWRTDATNASDAYARNVIRNRVIPAWRGR